MARIRSIHPGLLTDEAFMTLTVEQPLAIPLYLGLLMECDDHGVFEWKPMTLKARILPAIAGGIDPLLAALKENRFVEIFEVEGRRLGAVRNFMRFQKPKKPHHTYVITREIAHYAGMGSAQLDQEYPTGTEPVLYQGGTDAEAVFPGVGVGVGEGVGERKKEAAAAAREPRQDEAALLRDECSKLCGEEPCVAATDFYKLADLIGADGITRADVVEGVRVGLAKADRGYRFRSWWKFENWVRGAAKDRMATGPRKPLAAAPPPDDPNDPRIDFGNGCTAPESSIRAVLAQGKCPSQWGPEPGKTGCRIPERLWPKSFPNSAASRPAEASAA